MLCAERTQPTKTYKARQTSLKTAVSNPQPFVVSLSILKNVLRASLSPRWQKSKISVAQETLSERGAQSIITQSIYCTRYESTYSLLYSEMNHSTLYEGVCSSLRHTRRQHDTHTQLGRGVCILSVICCKSDIETGRPRFQLSERGEAGLGSTQRALRLLLFCLLRHEVNKRVVLGVG